jgi:hypothetical protein
MKPLKCLIGRHQWHNGWDEDRHQTLWTCKRCGATKRSDGRGGHSPSNPPPTDPGNLMWGAG